MSRKGIMGATLKRYSPIILRGTLWVGIAILTDLRASLSNLAAKGTIGTIDWADAFAGATLAGLIAWRLFLDQSISRFHEDNKNPSP